MFHMMLPSASGYQLVLVSFHASSITDLHSFDAMFILQQLATMRPVQNTDVYMPAFRVLDILVSLQPLQHSRLISLLVVRIGANGVGNNKQASIDTALVLVLEEAGDVLLDGVVGEFVQTHSNKPLVHNLVSPHLLLDNLPICLQPGPV